MTVPLTAGRDSGPGEMGRGSLPTSNGITPRCGTRFLPPRRPHGDHFMCSSCGFASGKEGGNVKTPALLSRDKGAGAGE